MKWVSVMIPVMLSVSLHCKGVSQSRSADAMGESALLLGGPCEGCEAVFEFGDRIPGSVDTLSDFNETGPRIRINGTVYKSGGKEPAEGVILYVYHTNQEGIYPTDRTSTGWGRRHGTIRGWVKTNSDGRYTFYTLKPASYPGGSDPAHIHATVLEPNGHYYWIEDFLFGDDPLLTSERIRRSHPRGGDGFVLSLNPSGDILTAVRDIELGKGIPGYE
jgi:protocatechuate 3,4-dioxygenase beta subunit